ncbi:thiamine monophosphate synthase [Nautilia profundicola AmH]|uniref:Thiamine monophosphate synthase n=1 Tax=Nautilia profundicola (strain ATCC BAA-1463 / DSM 18972 / AmH) TaxID=598659 RepID=B9L679_NAUPA|nr:thiamine phosphate synthase [Nautilia profundicola]ACM92640.1 thiamine monophosphate synthase [Nautilia profundicola AmH]
MRKLIKYMITDPKYTLEETKTTILKHKPDFVCYRNKQYYNENEIIEFAKFAKDYAKVFINIDSLKNTRLLYLFDGVHLPSSKLSLIDSFENKTIIASTHNTEEVKKSQKADFITFSPIFESKNRPGLGIETLNRICELHKNVIALGGIVSDKEVEEIKKSKAVGFASIRYFFT